MRALFDLHDRIFESIEERIAPWLLPTLARFCFAAVLLIYFWKSAKTKLGDGIMGIFSPSTGAYAQILPKQIEAVGYDTDLIGFGAKLVVLFGTWSEFILPALILIGLFTRLAALGMIGFVTVQSVVDITGHGVGATTIGKWFDRFPDSLILDQRLFWVFLLVVLVLRGAGPISVDRLLRRN